MYCDLGFVCVFLCFHLKPWGINPSSTRYLSSLTHKAPCQRSVLLLQLDLLWMDNENCPGQLLVSRLVFIDCKTLKTTYVSSNMCLWCSSMKTTTRQKMFLYIRVKHPYISPQREEWIFQHVAQWFNFIKTSYYQTWMQHSCVHS